MKEITKVMYEAFDGSKFDTATECYEYENKHSEEARKEKERIDGIKADVKRLKEMMLPDDIVPICEHYLDPENWWFNWFKVNNDEEAELLDKYVTYGDMPECRYPAYVCVESAYDFYQDVEQGNVGGDYIVTLDECIQETKSFFEEFGIRVTLTKDGEVL